jgi:hypothetical protein
MWLHPKLNWILNYCKFNNFWTDAGVAFVSAVQHISINDSKGSMLVSAHASTVYAVWRIKSKTKQMLPTVRPTQPNLT